MKPTRNVFKIEMIVHAKRKDYEPPHSAMRKMGEAMAHIKYDIHHLKCEIYEIPKERCNVCNMEINLNEEIELVAGCICPKCAKKIYTAMSKQKRSKKGTKENPGDSDE